LLRSKHLSVKFFQMRFKTILQPGEKYHLLTVLEFAGNKNFRPTYKCQCLCGKTTIAEARSIASGKTKSCGCFRSIIGQAHLGFPYKNYVGKRFDRLLVLEYDYNNIGKGAYLKCRCDCGKEKVIAARKLNHNIVKSCGCKHEEYKELFRQRRKNVTK
jgi:hypothetical protein